MFARCIVWLYFFCSWVLVIHAQDRERFISPSPIKTSSIALPGSSIEEQTGTVQNTTSTNIFSSDTSTCLCGVLPEIIPGAKQATLRTYEGIPKATCTPIIFSSYNPATERQARNYDTCNVISISYSWSIVSGSNIAAISGSSTQSTVSVAVSGDGIFTLRLVNTVSCSSTSTCTATTYYTDTVQNKSCTCTSGPVTINPVNKQGINWSYVGNGSGTCTGQHGTAPNLDTCGVQNTVYAWTLIAANGVASINGTSNTPALNVTVLGNGPFSLRLDVTTICNDGKSCTNYNFYYDTARVDSAKHCSCDVDVDCQRVNIQGNIRTYTGILKGGCTGQFGNSPPYQQCNIANTVWQWQVIEGNTVAQIVGADNQQTVNVQIIGTGKFKLRVQADVTCSDGSKSCGAFNFDYCDDSAGVQKNCGFGYTESNQPNMAGGLSDVVQRRSTIRRDDFIALIAKGSDFDKVTIECTPSYECDNSQQKSTKEVLLAGKVRFEWEIQSGEGNFVKLGCLPENVTSDVGDRVIFQPPYVALPTGNQNAATKTTVIFLRLVDETGTGLLLDQNVYDRVTITTRRTTSNPDHYEVDIQNIPWTPPSITLQENNNGVCKAVYTWDKGNDLVRPTVKRPAVPDNDKMVAGQWMVLEAENQNETDELKMLCDATSCTTEGGRKEYYDNMEWTWFIVDNSSGLKGSFVGGNTGRFVIYKAPDQLFLSDTSELTVEIVVSVANTGFQKDDVPLSSNRFTFKVYRPGVQIEYPPLNWVPEDTGSITLKSTLQYFNAGVWQPALAHMCRIHFFELLDVSTEKGICMNDPVPRRANQCRDLLLKMESHTEVFNRRNPPMPNCNAQQKYFVHARTQKPLKDASIKVYTEDFGAYGFLRSFANINQGGRDSIRGEQPLYLPLPIPPNMVPHPQGRAKRNIYTDNRVTVPRDVDENRIADGGWRITGGARVNDPQNPRDDNDSQLPGDGFAGDGLSNYQEYRGFTVAGDHLRTSITNKDLFVHNPDGFDLLVFRQALLNLGTGLVRVHQIEEEEYINNTRREINFNDNPQLNYVPLAPEPFRIQKGLLIRSMPASDTLTNGNTISTLGRGEPAPPNWILRVEIFPTTIARFAIRRNVNNAEKLRQVCAHELSHAVNIWHHGIGTNTLHGLRSGNMDCYMRYDNRLPRVPGYDPENIAVNLCNSPAGTGYNAVMPCVPPACFGDAAAPRGNCIGQIRISGRSVNFPRRN